MAPDIDRIHQVPLVDSSKRAAIITDKQILKKGPPSAEEKQALISRIEGQKLLVPDLISLLPGWRYGLHPDVDAVNEVIDEWLKTYLPSPFMNLNIKSS
jgi:hypothetical protein